METTVPVMSIDRRSVDFGEGNMFLLTFTEFDACSATLVCLADTGDQALNVNS